MKKIRLLLPLIFALLFAYLLQGQQAGVNVLVMDVLVLMLLYTSGRINAANTTQLILSSGLLISGFMSLLYGSATAVFANVISLILLVGISADNHTKQLINLVPASFSAGISGFYIYLSHLFSFNSNTGGKRYVARFLLIVLFPLIIALVFVMLYAGASPFFDALTGNFLERLGIWFEQLFKFIDPSNFWLFVAGLLISTAFVFGQSRDFFKLINESIPMQLHRQKRNPAGKPALLRIEFRSGIVLLILLNVLIGIMNVLDIWNVWFHFDWNGDYLKQFVHAGTWLLVFSIVISILIVLYYFRASLNFYPRRKLLLKLALVWLAQNALLSISVGIRNWLYIQHFNLAFKRIWVYAFLLLTLFGIATVMIKIINRKTNNYLFYYNSIAAYLMVVALGLINWDVVIARYNYKHYTTSFFHTDFMAFLDGSTLPVLRESTLQIAEIKEAQEQKFDFSDRYMSLYSYAKHVNKRCQNFVYGYPLLTWQSWNVADYRTYRALSKEMKINSYPPVNRDKADTSAVQSKQK
jgi:hypothetical protein